MTGNASVALARYLKWQSTLVANRPSQSCPTPVAFLTAAIHASLADMGPSIGEQRIAQVSATACADHECQPPNLLDAVVEGTASKRIRNQRIKKSSTAGWLPTGWAARLQ
jgi:hypothetical protein